MSISAKKNHLWHPCTQMKDHEMLPPLRVVSARGCYLTLADGRTILDGISSWWCKSLGHGHPALQSALQAQLEKFEHVMLAGTTNDTIELLSEKLASLSSTLNKVFYAGDGSCAVEIAMKMSVHARVVQGDNKRRRFLALANGYHGETIGALSVSDVGVYRDPYRDLLLPADFLAPLPYVSGANDPLWQDCSDYWQQLLPQLEKQQETITAIILEPILQGAGGMKIYSQDLLYRLRQWTASHGIHLIADEIMTGFGRAGKMFACEHAKIEPDFLCVSKGLTSGWLPLSATLTTQSIYDIFYDDYAAGKSFLHSHTYSGNPLAASVALATIDIIEKQRMCERATKLGADMKQHMQAIAARTGRLANVRGMGAVVAAEILGIERGRRVSVEVSRQAAALGMLLRPLGNTLYWLPPLIANENDLLLMAGITEEVVRSL